MTALEAFKSCLIELNKVQAPSLLLHDWIYLFNKSIQKYYNKRYNLFEKNQQITDDLRVLLRTVKIVLNPTKPEDEEVTQNANVFGTSYTCNLPNDYVHILNCICEFKSDSDRCKGNKTIQVGANKLSTAEWPHSINNYYMQPSVQRPYYYISNIEDPSVIDSDRDKQADKRYGNHTVPKMQIKCGKDNKYYLHAVYVDYLRSPKYVSLTQDDLDAIEDTTMILEFPDYVIYEIINEIVTLCLENARDQRLNTFLPISQSIAQPQSTRQQ